jgi:hypothetical protein
MSDGGNCATQFSLWKLHAASISRCCASSPCAPHLVHQASTTRAEAALRATEDAGTLATADLAAQRSKLATLQGSLRSKEREVARAAAALESAQAQAMAAAEQVHGAGRWVRGQGRVAMQ